MDPKVGDADKLGGPKLSAKTIVVTSLSGMINLTGTCDLRSQSLQMSFDSENWTDSPGLSTSWVSNCTTSKTFAISLDLSNPAVQTALGFVNGVASKKIIWVRGMTKVGGSKADDFTIDYQLPIAGGGGIAGNVLLGGYSPATSMNSGSFLLHARIGVPTTGGSMSSGSFKLNTGIQVK